MTSIRKVFTNLLLMSVFTLSSCSNRSSPAYEGYLIRQNEKKQSYIDLGYTNKEVKYKYASYVYMYSTKKYSYKARYIVKSPSGKNEYSEYFTWVVGDTYTTKISAYDYEIIYFSVNIGSSPGEMGSVR